jgi:ATP-dependent protease ClpP protease subunit
MLAPLAALILALTAPTPPLELKGPVTEKSVTPLIKAFEQAKKSHTKAVRLEINSPGGLNDAGYKLIDAMRSAHASGTVITCNVYRAYSMAAIIFEAACDVRHIRLDGQLMFHESGYLFIPEYMTKTKLRELADDLQKADQKTADTIAERMGMTPAQYMAFIAGKEQWVNGLEAMVRGFADELSLPPPGKPGEAEKDPPDSQD